MAENKPRNKIETNQKDTQVSSGGKTITVIVPKQFNLTVKPGETFTYYPGVQEMPKAHAEHWYSKHNGVQIYDRSKPKE